MPRDYKSWIEMNPLRAYRKSKRPVIPMKHVAMLICTTQTSMQNWEMGLVRPSAQNMAKIAEFMKVSQVDLEGSWTDWMRDKPEKEG